MTTDHEAHFVESSMLEGRLHYIRAQRALMLLRHIGISHSLD